MENGVRKSSIRKIEAKVNRRMAEIFPEFPRDIKLYPQEAH